MYIMTLLTGMPADVRIIDSSVEENTRASVAFAEANLACTKFGSDSDKFISIFIDDQTSRASQCLGGERERARYGAYVSAHGPSCFSMSPFEFRILRSMFNQLHSALSNGSANYHQIHTVRC